MEYGVKKENIMITKTYTYNVLDVEDVERIVSEFAGREIKIGEMEVELTDCLPMDELYEEYDVSDFGMNICVTVDGDEITDETGIFYLLEDDLPDGVLIPEKYIFNFDTKLFKSYVRRVDSSDY